MIIMSPTPLTAEELLKGGKCCGFGCQNCPYIPKHVRGSTEYLINGDNMTNLQPMNDTILVERDQPKEESEGGIMLPESSKKQERTATVVAVGPGRYLKSGKRAALPFSVGDKVLLAPLGSEIHHEGKDYVLVREKDVLAIVND